MVDKMCGCDVNRGQGWVVWLDEAFRVVKGKAFGSCVNSVLNLNLILKKSQQVDKTGAII